MTSFRPSPANLLTTYQKKKIDNNKTLVVMQIIFIFIIFCLCHTIYNKYFIILYHKEKLMFVFQAHWATKHTRSYIFRLVVPCHKAIISNFNKWNRHSYPTTTLEPTIIIVAFWNRRNGGLISKLFQMLVNNINTFILAVCIASLAAFLSLVDPRVLVRRIGVCRAGSRVYGGA